MGKYKFIIAFSMLITTGFLSTEAFSSSWDSYSREFPGFTAGGAISLPKMVGGEDAKIMTRRINQLELAVENQKDLLIKMVEQYRSGNHPYPLVRGLVSMETVPNFERAPAVIIPVPGNESGYPVAVPVSLHLKKASSKAEGIKAAGDFVLSQLFLSRKASNSSQEKKADKKEKFLNALRVLVWSFRPDNEDYADRQDFTGFESPSYLINLYVHLSAVVDSLLLKEIAKTSVAKKNQDEPDPALTSRLIQSYLKGKGCDPETLQEFTAFAPEVRAAYLRLAVVLLPDKDRASLSKYYLPWVIKNLDKESGVQDWLEGLMGIKSP